MTNIRQQIADSREFTKLISETLIAEVEKLENLDKRTNNLGKTLITLSELTESVQSDLKSEKTVLNDLTEQHAKIDENLNTVTEQLSAVQEVTNKTTESLDVVAASLNNVNDTQEKDKEEIVNTIHAHNEAYTQGVVELNETILEIVEIAKSIDYTNEFANIEKIVAETKQSFESVNDENNTRHHDLLERIASVTDEMNESIALMNSLSQQQEDLQDDIKSAIARTKSIDTKLEALSTAETTEFTSTFEDELEQLKEQVKFHESEELGENTDQEDVTIETIETIEE